MMSLEHFSDIQIIQAAFDDMKVEKVSSESELKDKVSDERSQGRLCGSQSYRL